MFFFLIFFQASGMEGWHEVEIKNEINEDWIEVEQSLDETKEFELMDFMLKLMGGTVFSNGIVALNNGNIASTTEMQRRLNIRNQIKSENQYFYLIKSEYENFISGKDQEKSTEKPKASLAKRLEIDLLERLLEIKKEQTKPKIKQIELHRSV